MAETGAITIPVTFNFRETLARELREAADALDPQPPSETAEDLRGADGEIERLRAVIDPNNDEAVEKVARLLNNKLYAERKEVVSDWDHLPNYLRIAYRGAGRAVLTALTALAGDQ